MKVEYKRKSYRYILFLLDIFSPFRWFVQLERMKSICVKSELDRIYKEPDVPARLQSDNRDQFEKNVKKHYMRNKIKMIR